MRDTIGAFFRSQFTLGGTHHFRYLHAIVFAGDAPHDTLRAVRGILEDSYPNQASKIRDTIDPANVGAIGAAEFARLKVQEPWLLGDIVYVYEPPELPDHLEL